MFDHDRVIKGLAECVSSKGCDSHGCPYYETSGICWDNLASDALALIRWQDNEIKYLKLLIDLKNEPEEHSNEKYISRLVVRCKNCTYRGEINCPQYYRLAELSDNYFCADGERQEGR